MSIFRTIYFLLAVVLSGSSLTPLMAEPAENSKYIREVKSHDWVIVFVHGIIGNSRETWTNAAAYWPDLITQDKDFDGASIYVYEYPTAVGATMSLSEVAENMRLIFDTDGVSDHRNIVFVAHSMGGLVVRNYLLKYRPVADRVRMSYFFSTPTTGSDIAKVISLLPRVGPQLWSMRPMEQASELANTQLEWQAAHFKFPSHCGYETAKTYGFIVVSQASATALCNTLIDPIPADHFNVVKPAGPRSPAYLAFKSAFIQARPRAQLPDNAIRLTTSDGEMPQNTYFSADRPYRLSLDLRVVFRSDTFNQEAYFNGFQRVEITNLPDHSGGSMQRIIDKEKVAGAAVSDLNSNPSPELHFAGDIALANAPNSGDTLTIRAGPRSWVIAIGDLNWKPGGTDVKGWWASATTRITMDDPDWIVPRYARILRSTSKDGKTVNSVLEAVIENLSKSTLPINELTIDASESEGAKCAALPSPDGNNWVEPPEKLVLNWPRVIENAAPGNKAAWVKLGTSAIPVKARFVEKGCQNPRLFEADIPVNLSIPPGGTGRIKLGITEMTQLPKAQRALIPRDPIAALPDWPYISITIKPQDRSFPKKIAVSH